MCYNTARRPRGCVEMEREHMEKEDRSLWIILAGIAVFSLWYTVAKRTVNALWLVLAAICFLILAYRLYGAFVAARAASLADQETAGATGASPTDGWIAFGYQFASIAGVPVLVGPVLAAQFGYLPGYLWALFAAVLVGAVHDLVILVASARRKGAFLPVLITQELGPWAGLAAWGIVIIALVVFLAVTGSYAADLLTGNIWGLYTVTTTVVIAILASTYEGWLRPGHLGEAIAMGIVLAAGAMVVGSRLANQTATGGVFASRGFVLFLIAAYCFVSAIAPLRVLGRARGAISGYLALGGVIFLAAGIAFAAPSLRQPATTQYLSGGGPLLPGGVFPYLAMVITAGAVSGFNALVSSGVTSRMIKRERDALPVGFGAMLVQSLLVVLILASVSTVYRWDFFAMTTSGHLNDIEKMATNGQKDWDNLRGTLQTNRYAVPGGTTNAELLDNVRSGSGATALSASAAWMFKDFPGVKRDWLPVIYRFMFVLQGLIILAVLETATRVSRVAVDEAGRAVMGAPPFARLRATPFSALAVTVGGTLLFTLVWLILAARVDLLGVLGFLGSVALLLAALGLGAGLASLRSKGRWALLLVGVPFVFVVLLAAVVGMVNIKDSVRYIGRTEALAQTYTDLPSWAGQLKFVNLDRAREVVKQWPAAEVAKLYVEKGQGEVAKQVQSRFGTSEADAKKLTSVIASRASGLSLWALVNTALTLLLFMLAIGVAVGRFVRVTLRWPSRAARAPVAAGAPVVEQPAVQAKPEAAAPPPAEPEDFEL